MRWILVLFFVSGPCNPVVASILSYFCCLDFFQLFLEASLTPVFISV